MESFKIILLSVAAAVTYGVLHDQVTARVCLEYFTVGHPRLFASEDPTLLALAWGTLATWWFGLFLGIPLALIARRGPPPKVDARTLIVPMLVLMAVVASAALLAGSVGYCCADWRFAPLIEPVLRVLPEETRAPYLADSFAHLTGYLTGFMGATMVWMWTWRRRN